MAPEQTFDPPVKSNQLLTRLELTFPVPEGFEKAGGEARLVSTSGKPADAVTGGFKTSQAPKVVTAEFRVQRGWKAKSFAAIELDGEPFSFSEAVFVDPILPRPLEIKLDPQATTEKTQVFRVLSSEALENGAELCRSGLTRNLGFVARLIKIDRAGLDVQIEVKRPEAKITDAKLILEVCLNSTRWIYMGQLLELGPEIVADDSSDPDQRETPEPPPPPAEPDPGVEVPWFVAWWALVKARPWLWSVIALVLTALVGFVAYEAYGLWRSKRSSPSQAVQPKPEPPQVPPPSTSQDRLSLEAIEGRFSEVLKRDLTPLKEDIRKVKSSLEDLQEKFFYSPPLGHIMDAWEGRDTVAPDPALFPGGAEANLSELVNRWWREGSDRARADFLLRSPSVKAYRSVNIHDSLRNLTNRTFTFQATDGPMEWLGRQQQGELLLVPCDPRQFETGDSRQFLGVLFDGLGRNLAKVRFRRVIRPCRLQRDPGSQDRYRLAQRGQIEMEGQAEAASSPLAVQPVALARVPQASPPAPAGMSETKLVKIVHDAIVEAVPRDLTARVEQLTQQVRSFRESEPQRAEPARLDLNLVAALDAMRKGVVAFEGELRIQATAIQEVKSLVEALRGDLLRIESELHHPDSAPPPSRGSLFPGTMEVSDIAAVVDRLGEGPAQPLVQENSFDVVATTEPVHVPQQVLEKLEKWWPARLPSAESSPDGDQLSEPSAYLWRLEETQRVLARVCQQRGWEVSLVHLSVPEGSAQSDTLLQITQPVAVSRDYRSANFRGSSFSDALLFQFALSIHGDAGKKIALLPAAGLRVDRHHHAYSRLTLGKLPESAMRLTQVLQPAVLSPAGQGGLYTVASPLKAEFR